MRMCVRERAHKGAHHVGSRKGEKKKETKRERLQRIVLTALEIAFSEATTALDHNACAEACARLATEPRFIFLCGKLWVWKNAATALTRPATARETQTQQH